MSNKQYEISDKVILEIGDVKTAVNLEYGRDISNEASILVLKHLMKNWNDDIDAEEIDGNIITALNHLCDNTKSITIAPQGGDFVIYEQEKNIPHTEQQLLELEKLAQDIIDGKVGGHWT